MASPRTTTRSMAKPFAVVTVLSPCKIQVLTPMHGQEISETHKYMLRFSQSHMQQKKQQMTKAKMKTRI